VVSRGRINVVPEPRRDAVRSAFREVFGNRSVGDLQPISGGVSGAAISQFEVGDRPYLLRLEPERIALPDRERGFFCMTAAAAAGVAPPVHHADPAAGVAIMDFIPGRPLGEHPGGMAGMVRELGDLTARVRATEPFPIIGDYPQIIGALLAKLEASGHFAPGVLAPHAEGLARIQADYPWDASARVSSHNDPNPRNILFDGARLWLIDWELAFRNDPLADVAILTTEFAQTPELEDVLLEAAFGRAPDGALRDRLQVMRLLTRLFYGAIVLENFTQAPAPAMETFTPDGFRAAVADGRLASGAPETAYAFGRMSLRAFADGLATPGFDEVLERVRQG
jgi:aminoglycoside phosphotransferase (APT) family kinase protein